MDDIEAGRGVLKGRIFMATRTVGFTDDIVPGGYVKGHDSEAKLSSFDQDAVADMGRITVYDNSQPPAPEFTTEGER